ncbi:MAG: hypothetical protein AB1634_09560 [Thermodesulfobacteriota bacterium]
MQTQAPSVDLSRVRTVIYHLPFGEPVVIPVDALVQFMDLGPGQVCDTSEINGILHFFPKGNS